MKRVLIVNIYITNPHNGMGGRHHYLASALAEKGYEVTMVGGRSHHNMARPFSRKAFDSSNFGYRFISLPLLKFQESQDPRRIVNWFLFTLMLPFLIFRFWNHRPDVVLYSSPSPIPFLGAELLAKQLGAKLVFEVRDIWPLTLELVGGKSAHHPFIRFMQWIEDRAYRVSDRVISNLEGAAEHMVERGMDYSKFAWIPNGIWRPELENADPLAPKISMKLPKNGFNLAYVGTMGEANSLGNLISAAILLKHRSEIHFTLVGSGTNEAGLRQRVRDAGLINVHFIGRIPKTQVQSLLKKVDACYLSGKKIPLYRFGIAAQKLYEYFYAGRPVIFAYSGKYDPVKAFGAGVTVPADSPDQLAKAIRNLAEKPLDQLESMGKNGRAGVIKYHDYDRIADLLAKVLFEK